MSRVCLSVMEVAKPGVEAHSGPERQQLQQHLHGEEAREHHVEDVHDVAEGFGLLVVLQQKKTTTWFQEFRDFCGLFFLA